MDSRPWPTRSWLPGAGLWRLRSMSGMSRQIEACAEAACERFGGIDILVNNAGTTAGAKPFLEISDADWDLSYAVNLRGPAQFCRAVIPVMIRRGGGAIVNNASLAGLGAEAGFGAYSASKHGLVALTKTIAAEFGSQGIRCNVVCPGFVNTDMHRGVNERLAREAGIGLDGDPAAALSRRGHGTSGRSGGDRRGDRFSRQPFVFLHHRRGTSRRGRHLRRAVGLAVRNAELVALRRFSYPRSPLA